MGNSKTWIIKVGTSNLMLEEKMTSYWQQLLPSIHYPLPSTKLTWPEIRSIHFSSLRVAINALGLNSNSLGAYCLAMHAIKDLAWVIFTLLREQKKKSTTWDICAQTVKKENFSESRRTTLNFCLKEVNACYKSRDQPGCVAWENVDQSTWRIFKLRRQRDRNGGQTSHRKSNSKQ